MLKYPHKKYDPKFLVDGVGILSIYHIIQTYTVDGFGSVHIPMILSYPIDSFDNTYMYRHTSY